MPLTSAPDDSPYVNEYDLLMQFRDVRIVSDPRLPHDLRIVANGQCVAKVYGIQSGEPNHILANLIVEAMVRHNEDLSSTSFEINEALAPRPTLELTSEMSLPPDFDRNDPLAMWNVHHDRDIVAETRHILGTTPVIPEDGGTIFDMSDMDFAMHIQNAGLLMDVHIDILAEAVRRVRESS